MNKQNYNKLVNVLQYLCILTLLISLLFSIGRWYISTVKLPPGYYIEHNGHLYRTYNKHGRLLVTTNSKFNAIHAAIAEENLNKDTALKYNTNWVRIIP